MCLKNHIKSSHNFLFWQTELNNNTSVFVSVAIPDSWLFQSQLNIQQPSVEFSPPAAPEYMFALSSRQLLAIHRYLERLYVNIGFARIQRFYRTCGQWCTSNKHCLSLNQILFSYHHSHLREINCFIQTSFIYSNGWRKSLLLVYQNIDSYI